MRERRAAAPEQVRASCAPVSTVAERFRTVLGGERGISAAPVIACSSRRFGLSSQVPPARICARGLGSYVLQSMKCFNGVLWQAHAACVRHPLRQRCTWAQRGAWSIYLHCILCSRKQAHGLLSSAAWGRTPLPTCVRVDHPAVRDASICTCLGAARNTRTGSCEPSKRSGAPTSGSRPVGGCGPPTGFLRSYLA